MFGRSLVHSPGGEIVLNNSVVDFFDFVILDGKISGNGSVLNASTGGLSGTLEPGGPSIGQIDFGGELHLTNNAVCNFQIGPGGTADLITDIGGPIKLDGTINLDALAGATPGTYVLFTYNNGSGLEDNGLDFGSVPSGFVGNINHEPQNQRFVLEVLELDEFALAENFQVIRGTVESGDLSSMELSDDQRLEVKLGFTLANTEPPVWLELESVLDNQIPESLSIQIESSVTSLGVDQRVEFFNFDTNTYELLSVDSTNLLDQTMTISGTGDISRFVELGTGNVKTRIGFKADGLITAFPWTAKIDRFFWAAGN